MAFIQVKPINVYEQSQRWMQFNVLFQRRLGSDDFKIFYLFQIWEVYLHFSFSIIRPYFEISVINIVIKII